MKRTLAMILAIVMTMALVACGGDKPTSTPSDPATSTPVQQGTAGLNKPDEPVPADPAVKYRDHVEIATSAVPTSLDPYQKSDVSHDVAFKLSHNQLIFYNYETRTYEPELAVEWKTEAGDSYWFKLRQGVKFQNGEELTADDVLWTWIERPKTMEKVGVTALVNLVDSVEVINDYELRVKLKSPNTDFLSSVGVSGASILNREACAADAANGFSIGTGGWKFTNHVANDQVSYEKFEDSWVWDGKETPTKTLTLRQRPEASAVTVAVQIGECATAVSGNGNEYETMKNDPSVRMNVFASETLEFMYFNMKNGVLADDPNLRKAIAYAIKYDDLNLARFDGLATRQKNFWGPNQPGRVELPDDLTVDYNLEKAKEYMAKSKQPNGCTINISTVAVFETYAVVIMENLKALGITVNVETLDSTGFNAKMNEGVGYDIGIYNISLNANATRFSFICNPTSTTNRAHYDNPEMLAKYNAAKAEPDEAKRMELLKEIQYAFAEDMPYVPFFTGVSYTIENAKAGGAQWSADTKHDFTYVWQQAE